MIAKPPLIILETPPRAWGRQTNLCVKICRRISDIEFALDSGDLYARDADNLRDELEECERVLNLINIG